jgi:hypothetical protein
MFMFLIVGIVFQLEAPADDGKTIPRDVIEDTMPNTKDVEEGNTQAEGTGPDDNREGDEV